MSEGFDADAERTAELERERDFYKLEYEVFVDHFDRHRKEIADLWRWLNEAKAEARKEATKSGGYERALQIMNRHLMTLSGIVRHDFTDVSEADMRAAVADGWLPEAFLSSIVHGDGSGEALPEAPYSLDEAQRRIAVARAELLEATAANIRLLDLPETVDRISHLERERDEAVARADVADYTREALAQRCMDLEARLAVEGRPTSGEDEVLRPGTVEEVNPEEVSPSSGVERELDANYAAINEASGDESRARRRVRRLMLERKVLLARARKEGLLVIPS